MNQIHNLNIPVLHKDKVDDEKFILNKNAKPFRLLTKDIALDNIFQELETTKDSEGNIVDTRFSSEIQDYIRDFLMSKNITFNDTGYLSLRSACYDLKYDDRLDLCNRINIKFDKNVDVNGKIKNSGGFFSKLGGMVLGGVATGTAVGLVANIVNPGFIPGKIGEAGKGLISAGVDSIGLGGFGGAAKSVVNSFLDNNILNQTLPINLVSGCLGGAALGVAGYGVASIVKNCVKRYDSSKSFKEFIEIDNKLYSEDNEEEARRIAIQAQEEGIELEGYSSISLA